MSNLSNSAKPKLVWRPMDVLKNVNMENVRFLEKDYSRPSENKFSTWHVNELPSKSAQADGTYGQHASDVDATSADKKGFPEGASALGKLDPELIESIKQEGPTLEIVPRVMTTS